MGKAGKYGYSNSRVKAMEAKLIGRTTMQNILSANDISTILSILFQTDYKKDISDYGGMGISVELIDFALSKNLAEHVDKLYAISPGSDKKIIGAVIAKWDLYNIKLALEAKDRKRSFDSIARYVIDYGAYNAIVIKDIMRETTIEGMLNRFMVNSPYKSILALAFDVYEKSRNITEAIAAIDKGYYEAISRTILKLQTINNSSAIVIRMEIDMANVLTLIRAKKLGLKFNDVERDIIDNGRIGRADLIRMYNSSQSLEALLQQIKLFDFKDAIESYRKNRQLLTFEISMKNQIFDKGMRLLRHTVLSFGTIIAYMYLKEIEVYTLRISINSKYYGLSKEDVSRLIVWKA